MQHECLFVWPRLPFYHVFLSPRSIDGESRFYMSWHRGMKHAARSGKLDIAMCLQTRAQCTTSAYTSIVHLILLSTSSLVSRNATHAVRGIDAMVTVIHGGRLQCTSVAPSSALPVCCTQPRRDHVRNQCNLIFSSTMSFVKNYTPPKPDASSSSDPYGPDP